jgi:hypothetical protein
VNYYSYFTEIEDEFVKRRGSHMLISPLDWLLIETWKQRGVPLHVVLRGINASFDAASKRVRRGRKVNSLFYCQQEVEAMFHEHCEARVGSNGQARSENGAAANGSGMAESAATDQSAAPFSREAIQVYLEERRDALRQLSAARADDQPLAEIFARAAERLDQVIADLRAVTAVAFEQLEADLTLIEELLLEGLRQSAGPEMLARLQREGHEQLRSYRRGMEPEVYQQTLANYVARQLREQYQVPRLSLFYL